MATDQQLLADVTGADGAANVTTADKSYAQMLYARAKIRRGDFDPIYRRNVLSEILQRENRYPDNNNALYFHIPFCKSRCAYCPFFIESHRPGQVAPYLDSLEREVSLKSQTPYVQSTVFGTVLVGGGTPSLLSIDEIARVAQLIRAFRLTSDAEITIECAASNLDRDKIRAIKELGFTKISLGFNALPDRLLAQLNCVNEVELAVDMGGQVVDSGLGLNIESNFGLVGQTDEDLRWQLRQILRFREPFQLTLYPGALFLHTPLMRRVEEQQPEFDVVAHWRRLERFDAVIEEALTAHGLRREDTALGYYSRGATPHRYWATEERFLGFGAGGGSNLEEGISGNLRDVEGYCKALASGDMPVESDVFVTERQSFERFVFSRVLYRKRAEGNLKERVAGDFFAFFGKEMGEVYDRVIEELVAKKWIRLENGTVRVAKKLMKILQSCSFVPFSVV